MLDDRYQITSNRESGEERFDIQMTPLSEKLPGILIEVKSGNVSIAFSGKKVSVTAEIEKI